MIGPGEAAGIETAPEPGDAEEIEEAAPGLSGATINRLVRATKAFVATQSWHDVIRLTEHEAALRARPRLLLWRVEAARLLRTRDVVTEAVPIARDVVMPPALRITTAWHATLAGWAEEAWAILDCGEEVRRDPTFLKSADRVLRVAVVPALRQAIKRTIRSVKGDPIELLIAKSPVRFPAAEPPRLSPPVPIAIVTARHVPPHHVTILRDMESRFRLDLEAPRPAHFVECADATIDRFGQVWSANGSIVRSQGKGTIPPETVRTEPLPMAHLAMGATRGIYHWLVDKVPALVWLLTPEGRDVPILISDWAGGFVEATLDLLGLPTAQRIVVADPVRCRRLLMPKLSMSALRNWSLVAPLFDRLIANATSRCRTEGLELPRKLYISRRDAVRRTLENELELEAALGERGFEFRQFSTMPLHEQIACVANADIVVAPHGAGLAHLIVAKPDVRIVELIPMLDAGHTLRFNYARLAMMRGYRYSAWLETQDTAGSAWRLALDQFLPFLDGTLAQAPG